jgi:hypothetical protein
MSEYVSYYHTERNHQGKSNTLLFHRITEGPRGELVQVARGSVGSCGGAEAGRSQFKVVTDLDPTKQQLLGNLDAFVQGYRGADTVLVYINGHGLQIGGQKEVDPFGRITNLDS